MPTPDDYRQAAQELISLMDIACAVLTDHGQMETSEELSAQASSYSWVWKAEPEEAQGDD